MAVPAAPEIEVTRQSQTPEPTLLNSQPPGTLSSQEQLAIEERLSAFRHHIGIHNHASLTSTTSRPASNIGIYQHVISSEQHSLRQYRLFAILINGALAAQIILSAALTALGASSGPHTAVTAFGALNTITAGFLTFLKGSGLPNRMKYYQNEWAKVRIYIEQREREFAHTLEPLQLQEEIAIIERMYENVRRDIEANTPDSYISMMGSKTERGATVQPAPSLARWVDAGNEHVKKTGEEVEKEMKDGEAQIENTIGTRLHETENKFMAIAERAAEKVLHMTKTHPRD